MQSCWGRLWQGKDYLRYFADHNSGTTAGNDQACLKACLPHEKESLCLTVWQVFHLWQCRALTYVIKNTCNQITFFLKKSLNTSGYTCLRLFFGVCSHSVASTCLKGWKTVANVVSIISDKTKSRDKLSESWILCLWSAAAALIVSGFLNHCLTFLAQLTFRRFRVIKTGHQ